MHKTVVYRPSKPQARLLVDGRRLKLSGIGRVAVRWHRPLQGAIKTVRISKKAGHWYACFSCEVAQKRLRVAQRRVARRTTGGKNRQKAIVLLQRQHEHLANQRKDALNKLAHALIERYDVIALEDLAISGMVHGNLAKSILDAGWGYLLQHLTHKAASAGRAIVLVDPNFTSKTCSNCGHVFEHLTLADRWVVCDCGLSLDRDHNAPINIRNRAGHARWGQARHEAGCPKKPPDFRPCGVSQLIIQLLIAQQLIRSGIRVDLAARQLVDEGVPAGLRSAATSSFKRRLLDDPLK